MKGTRYKRRGWFNESNRHRLAAQGISTNRYFKSKSPRQMSRQEVVTALETEMEARYPDFEKEMEQTLAEVEADATGIEEAPLPPAQPLIETYDPDKDSPRILDVRIPVPDVKGEFKRFDTGVTEQTERFFEETRERVPQELAEIGTAVGRPIKRAGSATVAGAKVAGTKAKGLAELYKQRREESAKSERAKLKEERKKLRETERDLRETEERRLRELFTNP